MVMSAQAPNKETVARIPGRERQGLASAQQYLQHKVEALFQALQESATHTYTHAVVSPIIRAVLGISMISEMLAACQQRQPTATDLLETQPRVEVPATLAPPSGEAELLPTNPLSTAVGTPIRIGLFDQGTLQQHVENIFVQQGALGRLDPVLFTGTDPTTPPPQSPLLNEPKQIF
jgi:hypothetical protein